MKERVTERTYERTRDLQSYIKKRQNNEHTMMINNKKDTECL